MSPSTGLSTSSVTSIAQRTANGGAIEASVIYKHGSFYYLFTSWDLCCRGTSSTYNIRVGRSTSPTSGFVDQAGVALTSGGGTLVLGTHGSIVGPGGQDLMDDADGPILVYHYYTSSGSFLGINRLDFSSGWPVRKFSTSTQGRVYSLYYRWLCDFSLLFRCFACRFILYTFCRTPVRSIHSIYKFFPPRIKYDLADLALIKRGIHLYRLIKTDNSVNQTGFITYASEYILTLD